MTALEAWALAVVALLVGRWIGRREAEDVLGRSLAEYASDLAQADRRTDWNRRKRERRSQ